LFFHGLEMASDGVEDQPELPQDPGGMVVQSGVFAAVRRCARCVEGGHGGRQAVVCKAYAKVPLSKWTQRAKKREASPPKPCSGVEKANLLYWYKWNELTVKTLVTPRWGDG
jgi:hypothetical protein